MLPILLLGLAASYAPNDVSLDDLKRFEMTATEVRDRIATTRQYNEFRLAKKPGTDEDTKTPCVYRNLLHALDTQDSPRNRLAALSSLRRELGDEDYSAGKLPPACPPKYQRDIERWLKGVDVSLQDLPRFKVTPAEVRDRYTVVRQFMFFIAMGHTDRKTLMEDLKSNDVYSHLGGALDTTESAKSRRMYLISLQRELGKKDYAAGKLPPACPAKYKDIFERWLNDPNAWGKPGGVRKEAT